MDEPQEVSILFCKHSSLPKLKGDFTFHICTAINALNPDQALGAQKIRGTWLIGIRTPEAKISLLQTNIMMNNIEVKLYPSNPYDLRAKRVEGERVVFKDLPLNEPHTLITDYLSTLPQIGECSNVFLSKARDNTNNTTRFLNGDRYIFTRLDPANPLPDKCVLGGHSCRIWCPSQRVQ